MLKLNLFFYLLFVFNFSYAQLDVLKNVSITANSFINLKKHNLIKILVMD